MIRVGIIGASGYTGVELARILCNHPGVELTIATSRQHAGRPLAEIFPNLRKKIALCCQDPAMEELGEQADIFFTAVPHKTAMDIVPKLLTSGKKVIDLSADFRLHDLSTYEQWYQKHTAIEYLNEAVYGLPELHRNNIRKARLVANPGCYPTSIILALTPLLENGVIDPRTIIADSKSGTSGAGRTAQTGSLFCEVHDGFKPYKVGRQHRHTPEIEQELSAIAKTSITITFTPHLLPISRGILSTVYASLKMEISQEEVTRLYEKRFAEEPFVRLLPKNTVAATQFVRGSNYCDIAFAIDRATNRIIVMSAIDNIVKGASGQAVQNMNILCGFDETLGLETVPLFP